jgi:type VI secretion system secreted protein VgrG
MDVMATTLPVTFKSPLGDALLFRDLSFTESLGGLPTGQLTLLSKSATVKANDLLGQPVSVQFELPGNRKRYFNGYVTSFRRGGVLGQLFRYHVQIQPWLWFLTRTSDCRIFLEKTAKEIIKDVLDGHSVAHAEFKGLYATYPKLTQCVQYRETDFNFVSRLMERHGIYYAFDYSDDGKQTLQLFDASANHSDDPHLAELLFLPEGGRQAPVEGYLSDWQSTRSIQPGRFALHGLHTDKPNTALRNQAGAPDPHDQADYEIYDSAYSYEDADAGALYSKVLDEQSGSEFDVYHGETNAYDLRIGRTFALKWHGDAAQNAKYLVTAASFQVSYTGYESTGAGDAVHYGCSFSAIPVAQQYRTQARTPHPFVQGPQLATVTGPAGEEIYTDELGRVKVIFHWDRYGTQGKAKGDKGAAIPPDKTSCWVPVAQLWAGNQFGAMFIPRIKQEVIVEFLEGDPDRPIITGRVYNKENPVPWTLPANKTQSGILTRSSLQGAVSNANMLRFEDKKGAEKLSIHAEKDQDISVEHDETHDVGHDRKKSIGNDETTDVKHDRTESVGNNETISIGKNRSEDVAENETISIGKNRSEDVGENESVSIAKNRDHTVGKSETLSVQENRSVTIGKKSTVDVGDDRETSIGKSDKLTVGKKFYLDATDEITLKTGSASLTMKSDGTIQLKGQDITIVGDGKIGIKASGDLVLKGSKIAEN